MLYVFLTYLTRVEVDSENLGGEEIGRKMTRRSAARIQSSSAKKGGGRVAKGGFAARAQRAAARNSRKK